MYDLTTCDPGQFDQIGRIADQLEPIIPAERIMLIGARCRDILHAAYGCKSMLRGTSDTDLAIALEDWAAFHAIRERFAASGDTGHRFLIADTPVDIVPFGPVENPAGTVEHPRPSEPMNVHGFRDAFDTAATIPGEQAVKIARPPAYAVLKLHAWLDRIEHDTTKDGPDLGLVIQWYLQDDALFDLSEQLLVRYDFDPHLTAAAAVGQDMVSILSTAEATILQERVRGADRAQLARHLRPYAHVDWAGSSERGLTDALFDSILT